MGRSFLNVDDLADLIGSAPGDCEMIARFFVSFFAVAAFLLAAQAASASPTAGDLGFSRPIRQSIANSGLPELVKFMRKLRVAILPETSSL